MPLKQAPTVILTNRQRKILESLKKGTHTPLHLIERSTIILMAADGVTNKQISREMEMDRNKVKRWRIRWDKAATETAKVEVEHPNRLKSWIQSVLSDEERSGAPATFTPEQVAHIMTMACQSPQSYGIPMSHWTPSELTRTVIKQGIVESISPRQVGRFLKRCGSQTSSKPLLVESEH
jgi:putative transposase